MRIEIDVDYTPSNKDVANARTDERYKHLFEVYVHDYDDGYHNEDSGLDKELEAKVRKIPARPRRLTDYYDGMDLYNQWMELLYEKHGGRKMFKAKLKHGVIKDYIPLKPRPKIKRIKQYAKLGIRLSESRLGFRHDWNAIHEWIDNVYIPSMHNEYVGDTPDNECEDESNTDYYDTDSYDNSYCDNSYEDDGLMFEIDDEDDDYELMSKKQRKKAKKKAKKAKKKAKKAKKEAKKREKQKMREIQDSLDNVMHSRLGYNGKNKHKQALAHDIDFTSEYLSMRGIDTEARGNKKPKKGMRRLLVSDFMKEDYMKYVEDTSPEVMSQFNGVLISSDSAEDIAMYRKIAEMGWNSYKLMKRANFNKRTLQSFKKVSKKKQKKKAKKEGNMVIDAGVGMVLEDIIQENGYDDIYDLHEDMMDCSWENVRSQYTGREGGILDSVCDDEELLRYVFS